VSTDAAFETIWDIFSPLLELHFPVKSKKFNKNFDKINNYMTRGLLVSRLNKLNLYKKQLSCPTPEKHFKLQKLQKYIQQNY